MSGNDSNAIVLLHSNTTDGSVVFTDSAVGGHSPHAFTAYGSVHHETDQQEFGTSSIQFNGTTDYLTLPDDTDWDWGTGDFTMDCWVRLDSIPSAGRMAARGDVEVGDGDWCWGVGTTWGGGTKFNFADRIAGGITNHLSDALTFNTNTWYHVAIVRNSGTITFYLDGVAVGTSSCAHDLSASTILYIGCRKKPAGPGEFLPGYMDELRISNIARWTSNFTRPIEAYSELIYEHLADLYLDTTTYKIHRGELYLDTEIAERIYEHRADVYLDLETYKPHSANALLDTQISRFLRQSIKLDTEITTISNLSGYIRDWRGEIVKKKCTIIISSLDGSVVYGQTESNASTGYYSTDIKAASGTSVFITCFYEGIFRSQTNLAGSLIEATV